MELLIAFPFNSRPAVSFAVPDWRLLPLTITTCESTPTGLCMVQWPASRTCGNILVPVRGRHGPSAVWAAARYLGQFPALPDPERLPAHGRQPEERTLPSTPEGYVCTASGAVRGPDGVLHRPVHTQGLREGALGEQRVSLTVVQFALCCIITIYALPLQLLLLLLPLDPLNCTSTACVLVFFFRNRHHLHI